ncbi:MAG TPA: 4Fe-4S binding protein [Candidatus Ozemobacteraceae bacterium]|nr:4Fe-4S binding protein [Candidatus Ozemobacteraceae bacterium]
MTDPVRPTASGRAFSVAVGARHGGLGATALAVDLALLLADRGIAALLVDADPLMPAAAARLETAWGEEIGVAALSPTVNHELCQRCGACSDFCAFDALELREAGIRFFPDRCIGCGGCRRICPSRAITETQRLLGTARRGIVDSRLSVLEARLAEDALGWSAPMTAWLRQSARPAPFQMIRAVPGIGRTAREAWRGVDRLVFLDDAATDVPVPGLETDRIIRIPSRAAPRTEPGAGMIRFDGSAETARAILRSGRLASSGGSVADGVHRLAGSLAELAGGAHG